MALSDKAREFAAVQRSIIWKFMLNVFAASLDLFAMRRINKRR